MNDETVEVTAEEKKPRRFAAKKTPAKKRAAKVVEEVVEETTEKPVRKLRASKSTDAEPAKRKPMTPAQLVKEADALTKRAAAVRVKAKILVGKEKLRTAKVAVKELTNDLKSLEKLKTVKEKELARAHDTVTKLTAEGVE